MGERTLRRRKSCLEVHLHFCVQSSTICTLLPSDELVIELASNYDGHHELKFQVECFLFHPYPLSTP
jgi:hypothetical protein